LAFIASGVRDFGNYAPLPHLQDTGKIAASRWSFSVVTYPPLLPYP